MEEVGRINREEHIAQQVVINLAALYCNECYVEEIQTLRGGQCDKLTQIHSHLRMLLCRYLLTFITPSRCYMYVLSHELRPPLAAMGTDR